MRFYVFTFGCAHPLYDRLQGVRATSEAKAREVMVSFYGTKPWCWCYEVEEPAGAGSEEPEVALFGDRYRLIKMILEEGDVYQ